MTKPTSGPWKFTPEYNRVYGKTPAGHPISVCETSARNGHLIAAAPDLLEVLRAFVLNRDSIKTEEPFEGALGKLMHMADAAIAKAEGRE